MGFNRRDGVEASELAEHRASFSASWVFIHHSQDTQDVGTCIPCLSVIFSEVGRAFISGNCGLVASCE